MKHEDVKAQVGATLPIAANMHPASRIPRYAIHLVLTLFILLSATYSIVVPAFETPDEIWHFAFIQHVASGQGLPVSAPNTQAFWRQQGVQAPGYYLAAAALTAWIDQDDFPEIYERANPHRAIGQPDTPDNRNYLIHYPDAEGWPWRGSILALHMARFFSVLLGAVTVYAVYRTLELILDRSAALLGAAFIAAIPQFVFISGSASNDNAINATAALVLWQLVGQVAGGGWQVAGEQGEQGERGGRAAYYAPRNRFLSLGIFLGLALISKLSALALVGLVGLVVLGMAWRARSWRPIGAAIVWIGGPVLLIAGWWYVRNWMLYDDPLAWNLWQDNILLRVVPADGLTIVSELGSLFRSFWGLFGWMNVAYPEWVYNLFAALSVIVLAGLVLQFRHWLEQRISATQPRLSWQFWAGGLLILWLLLLAVSWLRFMRIAPAAQGRYFFPAAPVLALLFVWGWRGYRKTRSEQVAWLFVGTFCLLTAATPFTVIGPVYAPPPTPIAEAQTAAAVFGVEEPQAAVVAVSASPEQLRPGETAIIEVTWQALAPLPEDDSVFVHLVDEDGFVVAQRDTMPGGGRLPTSRWQPGQVITDRYQVTVPATAYTPNRGTWVMGLYDHRSGERLPRLDEPGDGLRFGTVAIEVPEGPYAEDVPNPTRIDFADQVSLAGYQFSRRSVSPGEELTVTLYWQARSAVGRDYTVFVHMLDQGFEMHGGHDGAPEPPTSAWQAGEVIVDPHTFVVSPDAPPGLYQLEIGLYPWPSFDRLRLLDASGAEGADRLLLGPLRVER